MGGLSNSAPSLARPWSISSPVARRFRAAAGGRALTHAQYLTALVELHEMLRARADGGDAAAAADLQALTLQSVTV